MGISMNNVEMVDFFLQMQADFDLPDDKVCNPYFQTGWQNALLQYDKADCLKALQEYAESPQGINPPRIAKILEILRKNTGQKNAGSKTAGGAWNEIIETCRKGVLWAGAEKKKQILSSVEPKSQKALEMMAGCNADCSEEERARGAFRELVRIASSEMSSIRDIKEEFISAFNGIEMQNSRYTKMLTASDIPKISLPEIEKATERTENEPKNELETAPPSTAGAPKYILDIIEKRKRQYRSENRES